MSLITVRSLSKKYKIADKKPGIKGTIDHFFKRRIREITAVNNICFDIEQGEIVGFLGSNGAGKTTTLKMLCGLIHPTSGEILVAGHVPFLRKKNYLRQITLVMGQKQQLIWDLPPLDSLRVNAAVYGIRNKEANSRIEELASMLDLDSELSRPVRKLSLGERMKAELLAALIHRPSVLFLDEPTLGLDINSQLKVREFLSTYNQKYGATILITSHYMGDITSLCKRVLLINQGHLFFDGSLVKLTEKLSPSRCLQIELKKSINIEQFYQYGRIIFHKDNVIKLLIPKEKFADELVEILKNFPINDLEVSEPPIEQLIGRLLKTGLIDQ
ncbi:ATP-binding cassette domain-containing protein [Prochlorococcus sp. MIT 1307]|uniref:ABC transporter ATP-binding protein n=1 Tax=Prochlorococcus sp. MIT 1307 TaxID=3096219 RepID=UPI002A75248E|nr:ATP-binding cassette domain-containing protein [Prochlorococcus sp. MIT 1307]